MTHSLPSEPDLERTERELERRVEALEKAVKRLTGHTHYVRSGTTKGGYVNTEEKLR